MLALIIAVLTQALTFLPLAIGITISYNILRATDLTLDGSFVLGAAIFARLITLGTSPYLAGICALIAGALAGLMTALIQRGGRIDPLLAGVLATFILISGNLIIMGRPNINLLTQNTLLSAAFNQGDSYGWSLVAIYTAMFLLLAAFVVSSRLGLIWRALGDNPELLKRIGMNIEIYRMLGFAFTNCLSAAAGCLTAQTIGYADIGMGLGMTLTGIGAIILGQQILQPFLKKPLLRTGAEFFACIIGVLLYFFAVNALLRLDVNPLYVKLLLGIVLIFFLRTAVNSGLQRG